MTVSNHKMISFRNQIILPQIFMNIFFRGIFMNIYIFIQKTKMKTIYQINYSFTTPVTQQGRFLVP